MKVTNISLICLSFIVACMCCKDLEGTKYLSQSEVKDIIITEILRGDTTQIVWANISKEIVKPETVICKREDPNIVSPDAKTWLVFLCDVPIPPKFRYVFIHAVTGDILQVTPSTHLKSSMQVTLVPFIGYKKSIPFQ